MSMGRLYGSGRHTVTLREQAFVISVGGPST
jgi:hypothetical protein